MQPAVKILLALAAACDVVLVGALPTSMQSKKHAAPTALVMGKVAKLATLDNGANCTDSGDCLSNYCNPVLLAGSWRARPPPPSSPLSPDCPVC